MVMKMVMNKLALIATEAKVKHRIRLILNLLLQSTGFPKKDARFPKFKDISDLLSDDKEGEIM